MQFLTWPLIVLGLAVFEIISSADNAIINAEVLSTMSAKGRRWFLLWGILFAVFVVRGFLPLLIVWLTLPEFGFLGALTATFSSDPAVHRAIEGSAPVLLMSGGIFLVFLFLHWLFLEQKEYGMIGERFFYGKGLWFYAVASVILCLVVWFSLRIGSMLAFGGVIGSTLFFITSGFKANAERTEKSLMQSSLTDLSKILYLEVIDSTFSIDGVLGAFAFTLAVPLILVGNGIGAVVVRQLTVGNIENIRRLRYLKKGAMYSILFLGIIMLVDAFGFEVPSWASPLLTFVTVGYFFVKSLRFLKRQTPPR